ncbi:MAG: pentapeptide repeat-containing protein [Psychromonas sp.]
MPNYHPINHALRALHMNIRSNMHAEVKRHQIDFSPLKHLAMKHILKSGSASQQMLMGSMDKDKDKGQITGIVARLLQQELQDTTFENCQFNYADLRDTSFKLCKLGMANFQGANDFAAEFREYDLQGEVA